MSQKSKANAYNSRTLAQGWTGGTILATAFPGGVAEWLNAPVLKTGRPKGLVSSNLTPSAFLLNSGGRRPPLQKNCLDKGIRSIERY